MARSGGFGKLLLAGLAVFGYYKYTQMSENEKRNLKEKGKKFVDENLSGLKDMVGSGKSTASTPGNFGGNGGNSYT